MHKMNGISLVSPPRPIDSAQYNTVNEINANWVSIIPYAFCPFPEPSVTHDHERQWWGEKTEGIKTLIQMAKFNQQKVMLKPHLWVRSQGWAGDLNFKTNKEWLKWESEYRAYILHYAQIAESEKVALFCIGTEIRNSIKKRKSFWNQLIQDVKKIYHGPLTYAANWDNYQHVSFWSEMDYIGVDSYFPLSEKKFPDIKDLKVSQDSINHILKGFSNRYDKPILFTEFGFESIDYAAKGNWKFNKDTVNVNRNFQDQAFKMVFDNVWNEPWFAGGFIWKWHFNSRVGGKSCKRFTPQNKPAQLTISKHYQ